MRKWKDKERTRGFTILEILVVVSVIAILLAVISPRVKGMQDEANKARAKAELKTLLGAIESYKNNHSNALPDDIEDSLITASPQIIATTLSDPFETAGTSYLYETSGVYYAVASSGIDGDGATFAIAGTGVVTKATDDICATNGTGC